MGQKVNPNGFRVGIIKDWDSRWFTSKREFGDTLVEDYKIRKVLKKQLYAAGIPKIEIERTTDSATSQPRVRVNIHCAKPGMVIGKGGSEIGKLQAQIEKLIHKSVNVNIVEVPSVSTNAQLVAEDIASQLERRIAFRRATKMAMRNAMQPRRGANVIAAKGIKIQIGGRLNGADIARSETYHEGTIPL
ncbi:MAG: 30S ribosomal protein S3, partial [Ruthenibacterium sp.]